MSRLRRCGFSLPALAVAATAAAAQPVYRCGPDRSVYSQQPCADGTPVEVGDARSPAQRADARAAAAAARKTAAELAREREKAAKASPPAVAAGIEPKATDAGQRGAKTRRAEATVKPASAPAKDFVAIVPGSGKSRQASAPAR